ncbi:MAG TPA: uroporphyrinogen decarboxylase [Acidimicrobiia bacterium]|nr:uroporphyrinogen decarboxylase [Acidimicrobiia bacterium]
MRLLYALRREALDRPPIWFMRQAGRYLPEYRELRSRHSFVEAMSTPSLAAEITLQPTRRFPLDAAIVFSDIMTPLTALGVSIEFAPGPRLQPMGLMEVARLPEFEPAKVDFVAETISMARGLIDRPLAIIGFAGGPVTVLAYLLEGGGSQHFVGLRTAAHDDAIGDALGRLAGMTRAYLNLQIEGGADVVQLFDTWAGLLSRDHFTRWALPAARQALAGLKVPTIYFAPGATHLLDLFPRVGATAYAVDWRLSLGEAWQRVGESRPLQGNLDPALLLSNPDQVRAGTIRILEDASGRPGHIFGLGHGIFPATPLPNVEVMVKTVLEWRGYSLGETRQAG